MRFRGLLGTGVAAMMILSSARSAFAQVRGSGDAPRRTRVLVLYQQQWDAPPMVEFGDELRRVLQRESIEPVDLYQESLDFDRVGGREQSLALTSYFADKYRRTGVDVVIPVGSRALRFAIDRLRDVLPDVPIVFALCGVPQVDPAFLPPGVTGRLAPASRFEPTIALARRLQRDAQRVVIIGGAGAGDSGAVSVAIQAAKTAAADLPLSVVQGLSLDTLLRRAHAIPERSIVVFASYRQDAHGQAYEPLDIIGSIARATPAPVYTQLRSFVGEGVVGGAVTKFDDEGALTARHVLRVLRRRAGAPLPAVEPIENTFIVDARQLRRWQLPEHGLLPGTEVLFRERTLWQEYRNEMIGTVVLVIAEAVLISALLVERRRRKLAQQLADERQRAAETARHQIAHMGRLAIIGELAATISHEIRQPLGAIRANAESGAKLLKRGRGALLADERAFCLELFSDIVADDQGAAEIITRVRTLARNDDVPQRPVDLNAICTSAARLLQHEAYSRHAELALSLDDTRPVIVGDAVQLQQLVVNLALNALDVVAGAAHPRVSITTRDRADEVEIGVHDNGPGIPADARRHLFEPFFTTKAEGLGLGLAIVQSIVERHQGRVVVDDSADGGATFRVVLPRAVCVRAPADTAGAAAMRDDVREALPSHL